LPRFVRRLESEPALPLGAPFGVRVRVHPSAAFGAAVAALSLHRGVIRATVAEAWDAVAAAVLLTAVLVLSVIVRAVAAAAAGRGAAVSSERATVTLHLLGASVRTTKSASPRDDVRRAAAGLLTGLALALGGAAGWFACAGRPGLELAAAASAFLCIANTLIVSIHAFPAFPLDSGRFLRAALWRVGGDRHRATWLAARNSRWFALAMMATGVAVLAYGSGVGAVLLLVGWFVGESAESSRAASRAALVREFAASGALPDGSSSPGSSSLGPERAGSRHVMKPRAARTSKPGTLASGPKSPPVQNDEPGD
jgi:Zn-dependent protease